jgi:hypothetical protein
MSPRASWPKVQRHGYTQILPPLFLNFHHADGSALRIGGDMRASAGSDTTSRGHGQSPSICAGVSGWRGHARYTG